MNDFGCDRRQPARIIVCEKTGKWAGALRRQLSPAGRCVCETRSWPECWDEVAHSPASFLALELTSSNAEPLLRRLVDLTRHFPQARAMVVGEPGRERYEWAVREAGAIHAVFAVAQLAAAVRLIERHLALVPQPQLTLRETIWRRLPWSGRK